MSDLKPRGVPIELDGEIRHIFFTLNIIDQLEEEYDQTLYEIIEELTVAEQNNHMLRDIVTVLLNCEAERNARLGADTAQLVVSQEDVGNMIGLDNYYEVLKAVMEAYGISIPESEEGDEDPNETSGQTKS